MSETTLPPMTTTTPQVYIASSRRQRQTMVGNHHNTLNNQASSNSTTSTSTLQHSFLNFIHQQDAKEIIVKVKLFETTDTITEFKCLDTQTVRQFFQDLIVKDLMGGTATKSEQTNVILNMYSLLLVQQTTPSPTMRWIVNWDMPLRQLILTSKVCVSFHHLGINSLCS
jgi:chitinase